MSLLTRRSLLSSAAVLGSASAAHAFGLGLGNRMGHLGALGGAKGGGGDAPQTTSFLARTSGLSPTETNAYKALINGMVSDGTFALLDALYIFATNTTTTANLNLVSTSYGITQVSTVNFTADAGYMGDGISGYLDTGFAASTAGGHYALNSASFGAYILTNRLTGVAEAEMGADSVAGGDECYIYPWYTDGNNYSALNQAGGDAATATTVRGSWSISRTGVTTTEQYLNGSANKTMTDASTALPNLSFVIFARRAGTSGAPSEFSGDNIAAAFIGGGLNATQAAQVSNRINAYMTALGINVY